MAKGADRGLDLCPGQILGGKYVVEAYLGRDLKGSPGYRFSDSGIRDVHPISDLCYRIPELLTSFRKRSNTCPSAWLRASTEDSTPSSVVVASAV